MHRLPRKMSLASHTSAAILEEIASGRWSQWLPGEHELSAVLHVGRRTIRLALDQLSRDGVVKCEPGKRRRIIQHQSHKLSPTSNRVVLLSPVSLSLMNRFSIFLIDRLREHLAEEGYLLDVHADRGPYRARLSQHLKKLEETLHPAAWVLTQSTESMQNWFSQRKVPCVVVGSSHPGIKLSSVDFDYAAVCRHAVGQFLARGHRHVALLNPASHAAGDLEGAAGFREAIKISTTADVKATIVHHDGTVVHICKQLDALMKKPNRPTALLVSRAAHVVSILGHLLASGYRVPDDVAIISRDDDVFLENVVPSLARYSNNPDLSASKLSRAVLATIRGEKQFKQHKLMPKFVPGETLGHFESNRAGKI